MQNKTRDSAPGKLFIVSAPSGSGKTTLCNRLKDDIKDLYHSISATTRPPRPGEQDGVDYVFLSREQFESMIDTGAFLEYEENFGQFYGTPAGPIQTRLKEGTSCLLTIDVKGALKVRKRFPKESVLIFIEPPSMEELKKRLVTRSSDRKESIELRLKTAKEELACKDRYDYTVVNEDFDTAYSTLRKIISTEMATREA